MDHVAIMKKSLGLLEKIVKGSKTIESRWYLSKKAPWDRIKKEDTVYFKDSGCPVTVGAKVSGVLQHDDLNPEKVRELLDKYSLRLGLDDVDGFFETVKDKKYCVLVFLEQVKEIKPFAVDKTGYGLMSAWISVENISEIGV